MLSLDDNCKCLDKLSSEPPVHSTALDTRSNFSRWNFSSLNDNFSDSSNNNNSGSEVDDFKLMNVSVNNNTTEEKVNITSNYDNLKSNSDIHSNYLKNSNEASGEEIHRSKSSDKSYQSSVPYVQSMRDKHTNGEEVSEADCGNESCFNGGRCLPSFPGFR